ncbi:glutaredoxin family protein [Ningiella sp. W23]|uniref:glutaredoxin family protein n=1 Tax=Ningiella sp. W23 TaxID=3023715 RepID=UPI00375778FC
MVNDASELRLILYTGPHCELCDHAFTVYQNLAPANVSLVKQNIRDDAQLYHLYAVRIPVLKREDTGAELGWPFNENDLEQFLQ